MANTLTLPLSEGTQRKLRALAMLEGANVGSIETTLAGYLDEMITARCAELLGIMPEPARQNGGQMVGEEIERVPVGPDNPFVIVRVPAKKSFAAAERAAAGKPSEEVQEAFAGMDEVSGHELSGDEDPGETKSLAEQIEDEDAEALATLKGARRKDVGDDAEAFLDQSMSDSEDDDVPSVGGGYGRPAKATKSFEARRRKGGGARVSAHTGEEA